MTGNVMRDSLYMGGTLYQLSYCGASCMSLF